MEMLPPLAAVSLLLSLMGSVDEPVLPALATASLTGERWTPGPRLDSIFIRGVCVVDPGMLERIGGCQLTTAP